MKLVRQPWGSNSCGQACVATLTGATCEHICAVMGTKGKTRTKIIRETLKKFGFKVGDRRTLGFPPDDVTAMLWWTGENGCHWVVWHNKKYYDPIAGVFRRVPKHLEGARVTSYLKVEFPK